VHTVASLITSLCNRLAFRYHLVAHSLMVLLLETPLLTSLTGSENGSIMARMNMIYLTGKVSRSMISWDPHQPRY
jgi:hypothetical protein